MLYRALVDTSLVTEGVTLFKYQLLLLLLLLKQCSKAIFKENFCGRCRSSRYSRGAVPLRMFAPDSFFPISYLLSYLVLDTSYYTNKQFKAFKSLEAYTEASGVWLRNIGSRSRDSQQDCCCGKGETFATDERSSDPLDHRRK